MKTFEVGTTYYRGDRAFTVTKRTRCFVTVEWDGFRGRQSQRSKVHDFDGSECIKVKWFFLRAHHTERGKHPLPEAD